MKEDRLRKENTVWTVSEDYSFKPLLDLFDSRCWSLAMSIRLWIWRPLWSFCMSTMEKLS